MNNIANAAEAVPHFIQRRSLHIVENKRLGEIPARAPFLEKAPSSLSVESPHRVSNEHGTNDSFCNFRLCSR